MRKMTLLIMGFMITFSMVVNAEDITDANVTSKVDSKTTEKMTNRQKILALLAQKKKAKASRDKAFASRDKAFASRDKAFASRDKAFASRDTAKAENEAATLAIAAH